MGERFTRAFFRRDPVTVARALLGQRLVRVMDGRRLSGVIVETEAYLGAADAAAHTFNGRQTARNASMWKDGGTAYVYFTYGMHHCLNVVTQSAGDPTAVLIRALQPEEGGEVMRTHRTARVNRPPGGPSGPGRPRQEPYLCGGPARLTQALAIDRTLDGVDLIDSPVLFLERVRGRAYPARMVVTTPRIGVAYAGAWATKPLRFYLRGNPCVSKP